jgi:ribosomal protein S18 acetylase RimI-like enzyme
MNYSLRPAVDADFDFLYNLHRAAMREYVEPIWGWHEQWQAEYFRAKFDPTNRQIIEVDGRSVGVIVVEDKPEEIYLGLIELLPEYQGRGIGTSLLNRLIERAQATGRALTLHVLKTNHPARRLYERHSLRVVEEENHRFRMSYRSGSPEP